MTEKELIREIIKSKERLVNKPNQANFDDLCRLIDRLEYLNREPAQDYCVCGHPFSRHRPEHFGLPDFSCKSGCGCNNFALKVRY